MYGECGSIVGACRYVLLFLNCAMGVGLALVAVLSLLPSFLSFFLFNCSGTSFPPYTFSNLGETSSGGIMSR